MFFFSFLVLFSTINTRILVCCICMSYSVFVLLSSGALTTDTASLSVVVEHRPVPTQQPAVRRTSCVWAGPRSSGALLGDLVSGPRARGRGPRPTSGTPGSPRNSTFAYV